jgi:hypothetical protein
LDCGVRARRRGDQIAEREALTAKATEVDRVAVLEREVEDLRQRLALVEAFVDSRHREKLGLTLDDIRALWHGELMPPNEDVRHGKGPDGGIVAL